MPRTTSDGYIVDDNGIVIGYADQPAQPQTVRVGNVDPFKVQDQRFQANADARANRKETADLMTQPFDLRKAKADADKAEADAAKAVKELEGSQNPQMKANLRADALQKIALARDLRQRSNQWFATGFGSDLMGSFSGTPAFDLAKDTETLKNAGALQRIMEMAATNGGKNPLTPLSNADFQALSSSLTNLDPQQSDAQYQKNLGVVEELYRRAFEASGGGDVEAALAQQDNRQAIPGAMPGGEPPMGGQGGGQQPGLSPEQMGAANRNAALVSALSRDRGVVAGDPNATDTAVPLPQGFNQELISYVMSNRGTITPEQLDAKVTELASRFNYPARAGNSVDVVNAVRKGAPYQGIEPARRSMSQIEQLQNKAIQSPLGSAAAGYLNAGGMGIPQMLAPDTYGAIREVNPMSSMVGEVGGAITGTSLLGKAGAAAAAKFAPKLLGGGRAAQFGRNLATDMGFGAIYGGTTEGDPVTGALAAGLGSVGGQGLGSLAGKAVGGITQSPAAQTLKSLGVDNLTVGQMLGGKAKGIEDAMTSWPLVGDIVNARRLEGLQDFNRAALNEAGAPIGASVADTGQAGLDDLMAQVGGAYDNATRGVTVPLDQQFTADMAAVAGARNKLPPDRAGYFDKIGENRVGPIVDAGQMTGDTYQQSMRGLKSARSSAGQVVPGFEQEYRDGITLAMDALKGQMQRGGGQRVVDGLGRADTSNRLAKTIQNAQAAAKNGTGSGEVQIFTPAQLNTAAYAAQKKYPGQRPFATLADTGQQVLPSKVPDSGTAKRLATMALPSILGGAATGGGAGYTLGDASTGAASGAAMAALLMLGGSKAGQKAIKAALFDRPKSARAIGSAIRKRKGLFGSAPAPLLIENSAN